MVKKSTSDDNTFLAVVGGAPKPKPKPKPKPTPKKGGRKSQRGGNGDRTKKSEQLATNAAFQANAAKYAEAVFVVHENTTVSINDNDSSESLKFIRDFFRLVLEGETDIHDDLVKKKLFNKALYLITWAYLKHLTTVTSASATTQVIDINKRARISAMLYLSLYGKLPDNFSESTTNYTFPKYICCVTTDTSPSSTTATVLSDATTNNHFKMTGEDLDISNLLQNAYNIKKKYYDKIITDINYDVDVNTESRLIDDKFFTAQVTGGKKTATKKKTGGTDPAAAAKTLYDKQIEQISKRLDALMSVKKGGRKSAAR